MKKEILKNRLNQIIQLAQGALRDLNSGSGGRTAGKRLASGVATAREPKTLRDHILALKAGGCFKSALTPREVHSKLQSLYDCELKRVVVELIRLHDKKQLRKVRKVVGKKHLTAYAW